MTDYLPKGHNMIPIFQIDSFAAQPFAGNPAAVCLLDREREPAWMQALAAEMNLSETAFVVPQDDRFELRWFTPTTEVDLCGHGTLAAAHALWLAETVAADSAIRFVTRSGELTAVRRNEEIELDFPATPPEPTTAPQGLLEAMGVQPSYVGRSPFDKLLLVEDERVVRSLSPDFIKLTQTKVQGVIVTSPSSNPKFDFVSRYFAPAAGINEDPVTGSAHCCLAPFWSQRLGKESLVGYQASARGGVVRTVLCGDRVLLRGQAVLIFRGQLSSECEQYRGS